MLYKPPIKVTGMVLVFTLTVFLSAVLLFMVQPMIGKLMLPALGGSPGAWNTCLIFFQAVLLAGYLYAHLGIKWLGQTRHSLLHLGLMLVTVAWLGAAWSNKGGNPFKLPDSAGFLTESGSDPTWAVLALLASLVGLPFFVVSASAPLLQSWFSRTRHPSAKNPYFLYAASNLGSMISLLAYPFFVKRWLNMGEQGRVWTAGMGALFIGFAACAWMMRTRGARDRAVEEVRSSEPSPTRSRIASWIVLSFIPSSLLMGETTFLASEVLSHPLLWVATLALYLLTFINVFAAKPWIPHAAALRWTPIAVSLLVIVVAGKSNEPTWLVVGVHLFAFFMLTLVCHGELAKRKPSAEHLTSFYLWMSFGGVLGGAFNSLLAPVLFVHAGLVEYPLGLIASFLVLGLAAGKRVTATDCIFALGLGGLAAVLAAALPRSEGVLGNLGYGLPALGLMFALGRPLRFALAASALVLVGEFDPGPAGRALFTERNFYGVLKVTYDADRDCNLIIHGNTLHSLQSRNPSEAMFPTAYYYPDGPVSQVFAEAERRGFRNICVAGLGAGGIACYAKPGQHWTYYEIDPTMKRVAEDPRYFTFLRDCHPREGAAYEVKLGDARLEMGREPAGKFDLIVLNAFSSSSPPTHLLTKEAMALYLSKLAPDGLLVYNASNRHLELEPVLAAAAGDLGVHFRNGKDFVRNAEEKRRGKENCSFVVLARDAKTLEFLKESQGWTGPPRNLPRVWTDSYSDLLGSMKWR